MQKTSKAGVVRLPQPSTIGSNRSFYATAMLPTGRFEVSVPSTQVCNEQNVRRAAAIRAASSHIAAHHHQARLLVNWDAEVPVKQQVAGATLEQKRLYALLQQLTHLVVVLNEPFVKYMAKKFLVRNTSAEARDWYLAAGREGLVKALYAFDATQGTNFAGFASNHVHGTIARACCALEQPHMPYHDFIAFRQVAPIAEAFEQEHGRPATNEELAARTNVSATRISYIRHGGRSLLDARTRTGGKQAASHVVFGAPSFSFANPTNVAIGNVLNEGRVGVKNVAEFSDEEILALLREKLANCSALDALLVCRKTGWDGYEPETFPELADALGIGREILRLRAAAALQNI